MNKLKVCRGVVLCIGVLALLGGVAPLQAQSVDYIYWANFWEGAICRAKLDGSDVERTFIPGLTGTGGVAVNDDYIYWSQLCIDITGSMATGTTIGRANLDGTGVNPIFITGCRAPWGLAIDDKYIYWSNPIGNTIGRANLDGSDPNQDFIQDIIGSPRGIAVSGNYIYWGNCVCVARATLDGTVVESSWIAGEIMGNPHCVAVKGAYIYWTNYGSGGIGRANLDGTGAVLWQPTGREVLGIGIKENILYWGGWNGSSIGRINLDGSGSNNVWIYPSGSCPNLALTQNRKYNFEGFLSPIDNLPTVNQAKAGQAIPVKWRITDMNGLPIADPVSFINITSYRVDCSSFAGDPTNFVEEVAAGSSGLQYIGNGWWQFNWKTSKSYKGQCRTMKLTLDDKTEHTASFSFK